MFGIHGKRFIWALCEILSLTKFPSIRIAYAGQNFQAHRDQLKSIHSSVLHYNSSKYCMP